MNGATDHPTLSVQISAQTGRIDGALVGRLTTAIVDILAPARPDNHGATPAARPSRSVQIPAETAAA